MHDLISRQAAMDAIMGQPPEPHYPSWYAEQIKALPSAQPEQRSFSCCQENDLISRRAEIRTDEGVVWFDRQPDLQPTCNQLATDVISRQAVEHLDWFTKLYCRDKSITNDLAFRCKQCEFEMPDGTCLVKVMARKLCPDYKDFGAMGDL
jgi:hypothetical protein